MNGILDLSSFFSLILRRIISKKPLNFLLFYFPVSKGLHTATDTRESAQP
jgi:hypothetical protein